MTDLIVQINRLKKEIDDLRPLPKDLEARIIQKFRLDWNFHSNHIEGNKLTFGETKTFLLHGITAKGKPLKDHLDIKGHNEAILLLEDIIKQKRPLTESFIRGLHEIILKEPYEMPSINVDGIPVKRRIEIGQYKSAPNHVKTKTGEIFYFATPEETPAKMNDLMNWLREEQETNNLHPVQIAAQFHYKFIRIHPFDDGNGRMARILMNLILMAANYPPVVIKTDKKDAYFTALQLADGGNTEEFDAYIAEQLIASLELYLKGAKGGNLVEDDDVDKEIALLKMSLEGEVEKVELSVDNFGDIYQRLIFPIIEQVVEKLKGFDEMFFSSNVELRIVKAVTTKNNNSISTRYDNIIFVKESDKRFFISKIMGKNINSLETIPVYAYCTFFWQDFKKTTTNFGVNIDVVFRFEPLYVEIQSNGFINNKSLTFPKKRIIYIENLDEEYPKEVANALARHQLKFIKDKLKE